MSESQNVQDLYPELFTPGGAYDRLWLPTSSPDALNVSELRALFDLRVVNPDGSARATVGMALMVQATHCMLSPAMYRVTKGVVDKMGLSLDFLALAYQPIASEAEARALLRASKEWQSIFILGLMLDGLHGYPEARGWVHAARGHMLCGDIAILEILVRYLRDCDREGVQYIIGADPASTVAAAELKSLFGSMPDSREFEYDALRVLSVRAPVDFLLRGHTVSGDTRILRHLYDECTRNTGVLWVTQEQARTLVVAPWIPKEQRSRLLTAWKQYV